MGYDKEIQTELKRIVEYGLKDSLQGRQVDGTGQNIPWENEDHSLFRSQSALYHYYLYLLINGEGDLFFRGFVVLQVETVDDTVDQADGRHDDMLRLGMLCD